MSVSERIAQLVRHYVPIQAEHGHTFLAEHLNSDSIVLDLGANHGGFCRAMLKRYECRAFAVEANPRLAAHIRRDTRIAVLDAAAAGRNATFTFAIGENDQSSSITDATPGGADVVEVRGLDLPSIMAHFQLSRIDMLKIDIEGAEIEFLNAISPELLSRIKQITCEFHDFWGKGTTAEVEACIARICSFGFLDFRPGINDRTDICLVNAALCPGSRKAHARLKHVGRKLVSLYWSLKKPLCDCGMDRHWIDGPPGSDDPFLTMPLPSSSIPESG